MRRLKNSQPELEKLKELLLADELEQLKKLESKVDTLDFEAKDDATIMKRVTPAISKGIADNKETMIDALYPIMGGMISKYVTQAIKEMMETINNKIEDGLSFDKYKRKIKSKVTGVSETELLMEESSDATISSLFVIHKETSLLIAEAHLENKEIDDAHMVASMASAIKDFINDWMQNHDAQNEVQLLSYGTSTLYIESAGSVFVVAFLDAEPDHEQRTQINTFFASIVKEYANFFQYFDGDDSAEEIVTLSMKMEDYLYEHAPKQSAVTGTKSKKNPAKYIFIFLGLLLLGYGVYLFNAWYIDRSLEQKIYVQTGEKISISRDDDRLVLDGQISSLAKIAEIRNTIKHYNSDVKIQNNLSVPVTYLDKRFKALSNMGSASVKNIDEKFKLLERSFATSINSLNDKVLKLNQSMQESQTALSELIKQKDTEIDRLRQDKDTLEKVIAIKREINQKLDNALMGNPFYLQEEHALDFRNLNLFKVNDTHYHKEAIVVLAKVFEKYMNVLVEYRDYIKHINIEGHTDSSGLEADNIVLSKKRALSVKYYLERLRVVKQYHMARFMKVDGYGSAQKILYNGIEDKDASRRIKIKFELSDVKIVNKLRKIIND